ncbi:30S ribosomal protein S12 methylthiotransferase RimO [Candidatus Dependentiae bacterium]|nr:30S ribosomal protein S12 methylthiotransferase RimO [Candidatus Dependentiae bacterium]
MNKTIYYFISTLGCPKNDVESDSIRSVFESYSYIFKETLDYKKAGVILINTCGFIKSAVKQSDETIQFYIDSTSKNRFIIVTGCYAVRSKQALIDKFGNKILILKTNELNDYCKKLSEKISGTKVKSDPPALYRTNHSSSIYSYIRIADGCSRKCGFCVIPFIKGKYTSRPQKNIIDEAELLLNNGIKELILVSQDTGKYGKDINLKYGIAGLLKELNKLNYDFIIRIMYLSPDTVTKPLIKIISDTEKICNYIDMPIQHTENSILKKMRRNTTKKEIFEKIGFIKKYNPDISIRTSVITGYPGETEKIFEEMSESIIKLKFDKLGIFKYSDESETYSYTLKNKIPEKTINTRFNKLMNIQKKISYEQNKKFIGKTLKVLVDGYDPKTKFYLSRDSHNAPEIDGYILFKTKNNIDINNFLNIRITSGSDYDLTGELLQ